MVSALTSHSSPYTQSVMRRSTIITTLIIGLSEVGPTIFEYNYYVWYIQCVCVTVCFAAWLGHIHLCDILQCRPCPKWQLTFRPEWVNFSTSTLNGPWNIHFFIYLDNPSWMYLIFLWWVDDSSAKPKPCPLTHSFAGSNMFNADNVDIGHHGAHIVILHGLSISLYLNL